jgi:hypothetical protein
LGFIFFAREYLCSNLRASTRQGAEGQGVVDILLKYCRDSVAAEKMLDGKSRSRFGGGAGGFSGSWDGGMEEGDGGEDAATAALREDKGTKLKHSKGGKNSEKKNAVPKMLRYAEP